MSVRMPIFTTSSEICAAAGVAASASAAATTGTSSPVRYASRSACGSAASVAAATTEDLLDRVTVYSAGMEPAAVRLMEAELARRGVMGREIDAHGEMRRRDVLWHPDGVAVKCHKCPRPAVVRAWVWHRVFGVLPVFPVRVPLCAAHGKAGTPGDAPDRA